MTLVSKTTLSKRQSAHVMSDVQHVSKDPIIVTGGSFLSATVLGKKSDGTFTQLNPAGPEASAAEGVLFGAVDASAADQNGTAHTRVAAFHADRLVWPDGISQADKEAAIEELAAKNLILR